MPYTGSGPENAHTGDGPAGVPADVLPPDRGATRDYLRRSFREGRLRVTAEGADGFQSGGAVMTGHGGSLDDLATVARDEAGALRAALQRLGAMGLGLAAAAAGGAAAQRALRRSPRPGNH